MRKVLIWLKRTGIGLAVAAIVLIPGSIWLWQDRPSIDALKLPTSEVTQTGTSGVKVTWLGVTTLLFDDDETQILIDGFFSRPSIFDVVLRRPIVSDAATINYAQCWRSIPCRRRRRWTGWQWRRRPSHDRSAMGVCANASSINPALPCTSVVPNG